MRVVKTMDELLKMTRLPSLAERAEREQCEVLPLDDMDTRSNCDAEDARLQLWFNNMTGTNATATKRENEIIVVDRASKRLSEFKTSPSTKRSLLIDEKRCEGLGMPLTLLKDFVKKGVQGKNPERMLYLAPFLNTLGLTPSVTVMTLLNVFNNCQGSGMVTKKIKKQKKKEEKETTGGKNLLCSYSDLEGDLEATLELSEQFHDEHMKHKDVTSMQETTRDELCKQLWTVFSPTEFDSEVILCELFHLFLDEEVVRTAFAAATEQALAVEVTEDDIESFKDMLGSHPFGLPHNTVCSMREELLAVVLPPRFHQRDYASSCFLDTYCNTVMGLEMAQKKSVYEVVNFSTYKEIGDTQLVLNRLQEETQVVNEMGGCPANTWLTMIREWRRAANSVVLGRENVDSCGNSVKIEKVHAKDERAQVVQCR